MKVLVKYSGLLKWLLTVIASSVLLARYVYGKNNELGPAGTLTLSGTGLILATLAAITGVAAILFWVINSESQKHKTKNHE